MQRTARGALRETILLGQSAGWQAAPTVRVSAVVCRPASAGGAGRKNPRPGGGADDRGINIFHKISLRFQVRKGKRLFFRGV